MKSDFKEGFIELSDSNYPVLLKNIYDPPGRLYYRGNLSLLNQPNMLTIVGSRKMTQYHQSSLAKIISDFKNKALVIVSGLAIGIDGLAHRYALDNDLPTIAVLGSSLDEDSLYPRQNIGLAREIIAKGGLLLSENPPGTETQLWHFPKRNRILAGLSQATLVISGAQKSGTLITAQIAVDEARDVFALPANVNLSLSRGPNQLIKNGAHLLTSANDILKYYNLDTTSNQKITFKNKTHAKIYSTLQTEPLSLDKLSAKTKLSLAETNSLISELEIEGLVKFNQFNQVEII